MKKPDWKQVKPYEDITYHKCDGVARIAFNRPEVRNAFRPDTLLEMQEAFRDAERLLDRAAQRQLVHPNAAARLKSRLQKSISGAAAPS